MHSLTLLSPFLLLPAISFVAATPTSLHKPITLLKRTLDPCTSNTKGKCPGATNCSGTPLPPSLLSHRRAHIDPPLATKVSNAIQAAECSHNTRVSGQQTFAVFVTDHQYDKSHGAPYGTCSAYTCTAPTDAQMTDANADCWTFFWV